MGSCVPHIDATTYTFMEVYGGGGGSRGEVNWQFSTI